MKEIKAIIQPFLADHVLAALRELAELPGATVSEVKGFGRGRAVGARSDAQDGGVFGVQKVKLEIVVSDELAAKVIEAIVRHAHTGNPGDGKIFVSAVDEVVKIRTGERGEGAI